MEKSRKKIRRNNHTLGQSQQEVNPAVLHQGNTVFQEHYGPSTLWP